MIKCCLGNSQINSIPELRVFFHNFFFTEQTQSLRVHLARADIIRRSKRKIEVFFLPWKASFFH